MSFSFSADTASGWASATRTPAQGELMLETDTKVMKMGDGSTSYANLQPLQGINNILTLGNYDAWLTVNIPNTAPADAPNRMQFNYLGKETGGFNEKGEFRGVCGGYNSIGFRMFGKVAPTDPTHTGPIIDVMDDRTTRTELFYVGSSGEVWSNSSGTFTGAVSAPNIGNKVTSSSTAPSSPSTGDVWVQTS